MQRLRLEGKRWPPIVKVPNYRLPVAVSENDATASADELGAGIYEWVKEKS